jgi:hypothetical protein
LAVDLPLMGLVYLMVPLLWLVGLGADDASRTWSALPVTAGAAWAISSVFTTYERSSRAGVLLVTIAWLFVALVPTAVRSVPITLAVSSFALASAWLRCDAPRWLIYESGERSRRFEAATLRVVIPLLLSYVLMSSLMPVAAASDAWSGRVGIFPDYSGLAGGGVYRSLEQIAAFTLFGYAIAEYRGRFRDGISGLAPTVVAWAVPTSAVLQWIRGWHPAHGASASLFVLTVVGALAGAWIYVLQLDHVRALAGPRPPVAVGVAAA